jgi:hypothetical protein
MMPTAELLVMETTRSAACPIEATEYQEEPQEEKGLSARMIVSFIEAGFL